MDDVIREYMRELGRRSAAARRERSADFAAEMRERGAAGGRAGSGTPKTRRQKKPK